MFEVPLVSKVFEFRVELGSSVCYHRLWYSMFGEYRFEGSDDGGCGCTLQPPDNGKSAVVVNYQHVLDFVQFKKVDAEFCPRCVGDVVGL